MTLLAFGAEVSLDADFAALAVAASTGENLWEVNLAVYGSPAEVAAEAGRLYGATDNVGLFLDSMPSAPILGPLRDAGVWVHKLEAVDVAAASADFKALVKARAVRTSGHAALRDAMRSAAPRSLLSSFAFERRRVEADTSPLNACAFALWGLRRNEAEADVGVWVI